MKEMRLEVVRCGDGGCSTPTASLPMVMPGALGHDLGTRRKRRPIPKSAIVGNLVLLDVVRTDWLFGRSDDLPEAA